MACVYFIVFTQILKARDTGYSPYFLYLLTGLLAWQWFSQSMTETSRALLSEARLVRSTNLPRELWVVRVVIAKGVEFVLSLPVLAAFTIYYLVTGQTELHWGWCSSRWASPAVPAHGGHRPRPRPHDPGHGHRARGPHRAADGLLRDAGAVQRPGGAGGPRTCCFNPMTGITEFYRAGLFSRPLRCRRDDRRRGHHGVVLLIGVVTFPRLEPAVLKEI